MRLAGPTVRISSPPGAAVTTRTGCGRHRREPCPQLRHRRWCSSIDSPAGPEGRSRTAGRRAAGGRARGRPRHRSPARGRCRARPARGVVGLRRPRKHRATGSRRAARRVKMHSAPATRATSSSPAAICSRGAVDHRLRVVPPDHRERELAGHDPRRSDTSAPGFT